MYTYFRKKKQHFPWKQTIIHIVTNIKINNNKKNSVEFSELGRWRITEFDSWNDRENDADTGKELIY